MHTPGPWAVEARTHNRVLECDGGMHIATLHESHFEPNEIGANARLIAAAPELLDALKVARANLQFLPREDVVEQIDAAITKATEVR